MFDKYYVSKISKPFTCACFSLSLISVNQLFLYVHYYLFYSYLLKCFVCFDFEVHNENFGDEIMYLVIFVFLS